MFGILLNSVGSFAKILSLIVLLKADKTSSPELNDNDNDVLELSKAPPKIVCRVISQFGDKLLHSEIKVQLLNHASHLCFNIGHLTITNIQY